MGFADNLKEAVATAKAGVSMPRRLSSSKASHLQVHHAPPSATQRTYPVLLLHGFLQNSASMDKVSKTLANVGFLCYSYNYKTLGPGVSGAASCLKDLIPHLASGGKLYIVAHSMGGLVTRMALTDPSLDGVVDQVITLGTPHNGTGLANVVAKVLPTFSGWVKDFMPDSAVIHRLEDTACDPGVCWTSIYSTSDLIVPASSSFLTLPNSEVTNIELSGMGHAGILYSEESLSKVVDILISADDENCTRQVTPSVLPSQPNHGDVTDPNTKKLNVATPDQTDRVVELGSKVKKAKKSVKR